MIFHNEQIYFESILNVAGLEVGKQRLLSAHLPFLPASISERDKMFYLSSCIAFDSPLMVSQLSTYHPVHQSIAVQELIISCPSFSCTFVWACVCLCVCVYIRWVAEGSGRSAEMSGQEESGSGAGRQQCWSSYPTVPRLHTVSHTLM